MTGPAAPGNPAASREAIAALQLWASRPTGPTGAMPKRLRLPHPRPQREPRRKRSASGATPEWSTYDWTGAFRRAEELDPEAHKLLGQGDGQAAAPCWA
jgi:hypothetical protein